MLGFLFFFFFYSREHLSWHADQSCGEKSKWIFGWSWILTTFLLWNSADEDNQVDKLDPVFFIWELHAISTSNTISDQSLSQCRKVRRTVKTSVSLSSLCLSLCLLFPSLPLSLSFRLFSFFDSHAAIIPVIAGLTWQVTLGSYEGGLEHHRWCRGYVLVYAELCWTASLQDCHMQLMQAHIVVIVIVSWLPFSSNVLIILWEVNLHDCAMHIIMRWEWHTKSKVCYPHERKCAYRVFGLVWVAHVIWCAVHTKIFTV